MLNVGALVKVPFTRMIVIAVALPKVTFEPLMLPSNKLKLVVNLTGELKVNVPEPKEAKPEILPAVIVPLLVKLFVPAPV